MDASLLTLERIERETGRQLIERLYETSPDGLGLELPWNAAARTRAEKLVPDIPDKYWRTLYWEAFAQTINGKIGAIRPLLRVAEQTGNIVPGFFCKIPVDVLYLALWREALAEDHVGRVCPGCHGTFFASRTNRKRRYCSPRCKGRVNVRRHRAKALQSRKRQVATSAAQKVTRPGPRARA